MTFNPDDPKYTAYVLGELNDADRPRWTMKCNPIRKSPHSSTNCGPRRNAWRSSCDAEPLLKLADNQHQNIAGRREYTGISAKIAREPSHRFAWAIAISASLLLAAGTGWILRGANLDERQSECREQ